MSYAEGRAMTFAGVTMDQPTAQRLSAIEEL
jgi:hypothetical protein